MGTTYGQQVEFKTYSEQVTGGLVAFYPFNGNANDESGNGYHGTVNGATLAEDRFGSETRSYYFDGTSSFIEAIIGSSTFENDWTMTCWFNREGITNWGGLVSNVTENTSSPLLTFIDGTNSIGVNNSGVNNNNVSVDLGSDYLNYWAFAVMVYSKSTNEIRIIVKASNGNFEVTGNPDWVFNKSNNIYIGRHYYKGSEIFKGLIDDVRVYNTAITEDVITELYANFHQPPTVSTIGTESLEQTNVTLKGSIVSDGGVPITQQGFAVSNESNPDLDNNIGVFNAELGNEQFAATATELFPGTKYYARAFATNSKGTSYGDEISFTTLPGLATLTTLEVTEITQSTATSGGNIVSNGGTELTATGVVWSTNENPTLESNDGYTEDGATTGEFVSELTDLTYATTYYVRAYATNEAGTAYGNEQIFTSLAKLPEVTTTETTQITSNSATSGGTISSNGGAIVTARGIVWSTSQNPSLEVCEGIVSEENSHEEGGYIGSFESQISELIHATTYYVRAFATNEIGTAYGEELSFITLPILPELTTSEVSNITNNAATGGGNILSNGGSEVIVRGLVWSTNINPTLESNEGYTEEGVGIGEFVSELTSLAHATNYYVRAYATNDAGTAYGNEVSFTSLALAPAVNTKTEVTSITGNTAISGGEVTDDGGSAETIRGVVWSTTENPTLEECLGLTQDGTGAGLFNSNMTKLEGNTTYFIRAYAQNSGGVAYGDAVSFTTLKTPTLTTTAISDINTNSAKSGGNVTSTGDASVTTTGVCWSTQPKPTINDSKSEDGSGTGEFTSSITGLEEGTLYYVRAYATTENGTGYGEELSFYTHTLPTVTTSEITDIEHSSAAGGGNVTFNGYTNIIARGICWSKVTNPTTSSYKTEDGTATGEFASTMVGLEPNTTYYVRAYVTNSVGTSYGEEVSFTTLTTLPTVIATATGPTGGTTASVTVNVEASGGANVTVRGVCYATTQIPTLSNSQTTNGEGVGNFTAQLTSLIPNTTYYARAYATNSQGTSYSNQVTIKTHSSDVVNGLITHYPFNGNANDESGNGNNGTVSGATPSNDRFGVENSAYSFNGSSSYIVSATNVSETDFTLSVWFKTSTKNGGIFSVGQGNLGGTGNDRHVYLSNGNIKTRLFSNEVLTTSGTDYADGKWHHIIYSYGPDRGQSIYVDGVLKMQGTKKSSDFAAQDRFHIGFSNDASPNYFSGQIDDVRIYSTSLSEEVIAELYGNYHQQPMVQTLGVNNVVQTSASLTGKLLSDGNANVTQKGFVLGLQGEPTIDSNLQLIEETNISTESLVAHYPFNGNANDESGNSNNATIGGAEYQYVSWFDYGCWCMVHEWKWAPIPTPNITFNRFGDTNSAYSFYRKGHFISTPIFNSSNISVSLWYRYEGNSNDWNTLLCRNGGTYHHLIVSTAGEIGVWDGSFKGSGYILENGKTYHIVVVKSGTNSKVFINRELIQSITTFSNATGPLSVIGNVNTSTPTQGALGVIDDIYIYNRVLTETEIADLYNSTGIGFTATATSLAPGTTYYARAFANNAKGKGYGEEISFTTAPGLASVTTAEVGDITQSSAVSGGEVVSNGGGIVTARGVVWSTNENPTLEQNDGFTENGDEIGAFESTLPELTHITTYYVRAYVTNEYGTNYGEQLSFTTLPLLPEVTTTSIEAITGNTATGGGEVTSDGDGTLSARGLVWSTSQNPTLEENMGYTDNGIDVGTFASELTDLTGSTTYYVRAYATNESGTTYGNEVSFTTLATPTVTTADISGISSTAAISGGNVTATGGSPVTLRGVCWSTTPNPTIANSKTENGGGVGSYTSNLMELLPGTTYYVRAYATSTNGTGYGVEKTFATHIEPTVATTEVSNITAFEASVESEVTFYGNTPVTARGVVWSTVQNPTVDTNQGITEDGDGDGVWTSELTELSHNTSYYVRAYATNSVGTSYGEELNFTTRNGVAILTTNVATEITGTTAQSGGEITDDGGSTITSRGICWNTTENPTIANQKLRMAMV